MNAAADVTNQLIQQLYQQSRTRPLWGRSKHDQITADLLARIAEIHDLSTLPSVFAHLVSNSAHVQTAARNAVYALLSGASSQDILTVAEVFGRSWAWYFPNSWDTLAPSSLDSFAGNDMARCPILGVASLHRSGFVRQEAVRLLAKMRDGSELPYLLVRLNDWVNVISADAQSAVEDRFSAEYQSHLLRHLPLVMRLAAFRRRDHSQIVRRVVALLVAAENEEALKRVVRSPDVQLRRQTVQIALELHGSHVPRIVLLGVAVEDPIIRLRCSRLAGRCLNGEQLITVLQRLRQDSFMPVRREALLAAAAALPEQAKRIWESVLLDASSSIRDLARHNLSKGSDFDAAAFYRRSLARTPLALAALEGLGETGVASDLPTFRNHLDDSRPRWRRAAIRGLAVVGGPAANEELIRRLPGERPRNARAILRLIEGRLDSSANEQLFAMLSEEHAEHVQEAAIRLIASTGRWQSLPLLLRASVHTNPYIAAIAQQVVEASISNNRVFTRPSQAEREALHHAWLDSESLMPPHFRLAVKQWQDRI